MRITYILLQLVGLILFITGLSLFLVRVVFRGSPEIKNFWKTFAKRLIFLTSGVFALFFIGLGILFDFSGGFTVGRINVYSLMIFLGIIFGGLVGSAIVIIVYRAGIKASPLMPCPSCQYKKKGSIILYCNKCCEIHCSKCAINNQCPNCKVEAVPIKEADETKEISGLNLTN